MKQRRTLSGSRKSLLPPDLHIYPDGIINKIGCLPLLPPGVTCIAFCVPFVGRGQRLTSSHERFGKGPVNKPMEHTDTHLELAARFRLIHELAGSPPLKTLASKAAAALLASGSLRPGSLSAQRLSDRRTGKTVPVKYDGLADTLRIPITAA